MPADTGGGGFAAFDSMPDAVIVVGRNGTIVHANVHAEQFFGYEQGTR